MSETVGPVIGTNDAEPLQFWVGVPEDRYLQLDEVVAVTTPVPGHGEVSLYGVVDIVRAGYEGARFDSDVFRVEEGVLPVGVSTAAHVSVTRVEPEVFVPPRPGQPVRRASGDERDRALFFDCMARRFPAGLSRDGQPLWGSLDFLDGSKGAHVNISGVSGVATKTSYALFLLYGLFHTECLGHDRTNARAIVFNVKGDDLVFLDKENGRLQEDERRRYTGLTLPVGPFQSASFWAPTRKESLEPVPDLGSRQEGVTPYFWSLREFCQGGLLRFLFAEADSETSQLSYAVSVAERYLEQQTRGQRDRGWVEIDGQRITDFDDLVELLRDKREEVFERSRIASGTQDAFLRRLGAVAEAVGHLVRRTDSEEEEQRHRIDWRARQVNVIDIHKLPDRAKRFVVGVVLKQMMKAKDDAGTSRPLVFTVLDELNKYAPREGWSPIKEIVLDIAERGRSLGVILIGAQQTASEVERRVVANASFRVVGRLDTAEAQRGEYGFLTDAARPRAALLKPGTMFLHQPEIPLPLLAQFPFPSWATRPDEVAESVGTPPGFER
ncbi:MAG: ATP-binding protein [Dehalococcoidia bacterium]